MKKMYFHVGDRVVLVHGRGGSWITGSYTVIKATPTKVMLSDYSLWTQTGFGLRRADRNFTLIRELVADMADLDIVDVVR